jgi:putative protein kinase ArgK-like GTPase of G3E family
MANQLRREIRAMMEMLDFIGWVPELAMTQALAGEGIDALWSAIERHVIYLNETGEILVKRREAFLHHVRQLALGRLQRQLDQALPFELEAGLDPYEAADRLVVELTKRGDDSGATVAYPARPRATVKGLT